MKSKRYTVEAQAWRSGTWEAIYYTDRLTVAKQYATSVVRSREIRATRVVDEITGQVMADEPADQT